MPLNRNPIVLDLLSWHGHERSGVRVPFSSVGGNPLRDAEGKPLLIETGLILRLRELARQIAAGESAPRWIFLIGGPGNGKSEAIQDFLLTLDSELRAEGSLATLLGERFAANPLVPWRVEVDPAASSPLPQSFREQVGRLIVVQDASASDGPLGDAAMALSSFLEDLLDLVTSPPPLPIFICCVNRGLLARALRTAQEGAVRDLVAGLIRATALGGEALQESRSSCWPIEAEGPLNGVVACWPLDVESLLLRPDEGGIEPSPIDQIFGAAVKADKWEIDGGCANCDDADLCPFHQNAISLRESDKRRSLLSLLRRGELATSRRWNFRDSFSLAAELLVGEWTDFGAVEHPCDWVHEEAAKAQSTSSPAARAGAAYQLIARLYPHALFPASPSSGLAQPIRAAAIQKGFEISLSVETSLAATLNQVPTNYVRSILREVLLPRLDPTLLSPHNASHPIAQLEDRYSQSVSLGNAGWPVGVSPFRAEEVFLKLVEEAELEWDLLSRESAQVSGVLRFLRTSASVLAKRSVAVRIGAHANEAYLAEYERTIRNEEALDDLLDSVRALMGGNGFRFNSLESFGQPGSESDWLVTLLGNSLPIEPITPAPSGGSRLPKHDLPSIRVSGYSIPLTFDLYAALRLSRDGCAQGSLPSSVRAALDRIRHRFAGLLCRDEGQFASGSAEFEIRDAGRVVLTRRGDPPRFRPRR